MVTKFTDLHFQGGGSDKVYHCAIEERDGGFAVKFAYGRRGSTLARGDKTTSPVPLEKAEKIYEGLIKEKVGKGYVPAPGISGQVFAGSDAADGTIPAADNRASVLAGQKTKSGVLPQLLNPCSEEEIIKLAKNPAWGMQEKMNGERRIVRSDGAGKVEFINRKGFVIPGSSAIASAVAKIGEPLLLDGEQIGDTLFAFGLLEYKNKDMKRTPYAKVFGTLSEALKGRTGPGLQLVPLATTTKEKLALFGKVKKEKGEGVVVKKLDSVYREDRPSTGGDHLKFKFWESASCIVIDINDKRSVQIGVLDGSGDIVNVGNVTIPQNKEIPKKGDIIEVRYLYAYENGCLFQPNFEGKRSDISHEDCTQRQLKFYEGNSVAATPGL